ncbi:Alpha crystallin/Hsp20 domain [Macleaya cordata]|uniref:Alpha crystallin/Hsp20 domain n=1 Tax=Macleaya cordata TaxID=56857 RepID=A0A200QD02_MACCD|nr:Alpha crystallin/Hsp20 domain [Macleaya cordata]
MGINNCKAASNDQNYPDKYEYIVNIPAGLRAEEIEVNLKVGNVLVISGTRHEINNNNQEVLRKIFILPRDVNIESISAVISHNNLADYYDDVLTITIEKLPMRKTLKIIQVKEEIDWKQIRKDIASVVKNYGLIRDESGKFYL